MYVEGLEADLNEKKPINTVDFILQVNNRLMKQNTYSSCDLSGGVLRT